MRKVYTILTMAVLLSLVSCTMVGAKRPNYYYIIELYSGGQMVKTYNAPRARHFREGVKLIDRYGNEVYVTGTFSVTRHEIKN